MLMTDRAIQQVSESQLVSMVSARTDYLKDSRILVMMVIVFLSQFRYLVNWVHLPYTSVRFGWSISKASAHVSTIAM